METVKPAYNFADHVIACQRAHKSVLVCGLDPQLEEIPKFLFLQFRHLGDPLEIVHHVIVEFNRRIINAVAPYVCGFKPQIAFYEKYGSWGVRALQETRQMIESTGLVCIVDAKRGDGGPTATAYAGLVTDVSLPQFSGKVLSFVAKPVMNFDAMTVHPWIDEAQMRPMLEKVVPAGKGLFVVCKTSFNPESRVENYVSETGDKIWVRVAKNVYDWSEGTEGKEGYRTIGVVLGATRPIDADGMRQILPYNLKLIPGYGAQGGGAKGAVRSFNKDGFGGLVNSSRGILYAYKKGPFACDETEFMTAAAKEAERSCNELNEALEKRIKELEQGVES